MKKIVFFFLLFLACFAEISGQEGPYTRIRIPFGDYPLLGYLGLPLEEAQVRPGVWVQLEVSALERQRIENAGITYDVLIPDLSAHYASRARETTFIPSYSSGNYPVPAGFQLGSMGGHLTYQEVLDQLDSMAAKYPQLITQRQPIGTYLTEGGHPIYWVKISDNPHLTESEPKVLYTSLHHAREPAGLMALVYFMHHLLENYPNDPEVQYLINEREMFFILVLNPDGYVYNQTTHPYGGGMWRKNLRNNGNGNFGVDLNRNYGYKWGLDNSGSSPLPQDDTYRGPSAFSEPETQAIRDFCNTHAFRLALNYHTYANLLLYPWGWTDQQLTPDDSAFQAIAERMTRDNKYAYGPGSTTIYLTNGGSDDWMYGDTTTKPKILAYTPELGSSNDGFWASPNRIIPICQENMIQNLIAAHVVGDYADAKDVSSPFLPSLNGFIPLEIQRLGIDNVASYTLSLQGGVGVLSTGSPIVFQGMAYLEKRIDSISFQLDPSLLPGQKVSFIIGVNNGLFTHYDTITKIFGQPIPLFLDQAVNMQNWTSNGWGLSSQYFVSPPYSFADSPSGHYNPNSNTHMTLNNSINLMTANYALLSFNARWRIEAGWDYAQVKVSKDNGASWKAVGGKYSKLASDYQPYGEIVYDGYQSTWVQEQIDLSEYLGHTIRIRFSFVSDNFVQDEGMYLDDIRVSSIDNTAGIVSPMTHPMLRIHPNPAAHDIYLEWDPPSIKHSTVVKIYSTWGAMVKTYQYPHGTASAVIDISDLNAGLYICRLEIEGRTSLTTQFIRK